MNIESRNRLFILGKEKKENESPKEEVKKRTWSNIKDAKQDIDAQVLRNLANGNKMWGTA